MDQLMAVQVKQDSRCTAPGTKAQLGQVHIREIAFLLQSCLDGRLYTGF
jgi:hypothetical protein